MVTRCTQRYKDRMRFAYYYKNKVRKAAADGIIACECCGWRPPSKHWRIIRLHHIIPVSAGGQDSSANTVFLCPNCHALAHSMCHTIQGRYCGPTGKDGLIQMLQQGDANYQGEMARLLAEAW